MERRPSAQRIDHGRSFLEAMDSGGLPVLACYWRRLRPTTRCWALVLSSRMFSERGTAGLERLLELWRECEEQTSAIGPLDVWTLSDEAEEPNDYARVLGDHCDAWAARAPVHYLGSEALPPAVVYRLPSP
ncbi:MAG: hypothetical protein O2816_08455 [Planctomycetota bacterium]|nr:hypothetical protein [Planctomycetota bacterium]